LLEINGKASSLEKSFKASANGCKRPQTPTLAGPLRSWEYLKTLRSNSVKKATEIKTKMKI
jgi:hypothetical protein